MVRGRGLTRGLAQKQNRFIGDFMQRRIRRTEVVSATVWGLMAILLGGSILPAASQTQDLPRTKEGPTAQTDPSGGVSSGATSVDTRPLSADPKALLTLEQIPPSITPPKSNSDIGPLSDRAQQQIVKARTLLAEQRYTEAAIELERALRTDANHPAIHAVLAELHWRAGNIERARTHATRAIEASPDLAAAHYVLGRFQSKAGETTSALYSFRMALACPDFAEDQDLAALCRFHLAELLAREGYATAALGQYEQFEVLAGKLRDAPQQQVWSVELRSVAASPNAVAEPRARLLGHLGRYAEAAQVLAPVVAARPNDASLGVELAELLMRAGQLDEAFSAISKIDADDERVISLIFEIAEKSGKPQQADAAIRARMARRPDDADLALRFADVLSRAGRRVDAAAVLDEFLIGHPEASAIRIQLIEYHLDAGRWEESLGLAAEGVRRDPSWADRVSLVLAAAVVKSKPPTGVLDEAEAPTDFAGQYVLGVLAASCGDADRAIDLLTQSIAENNDFLSGRVALAQIYFDRYRYDLAQQALPLEIGTLKSPACELMWARIFDRLDKTETAEQHYRNAIQINRDDPEAKYALAEMYYRHGDIEQAQRQLKTVIHQHPEREDARELLAVTYWNAEKADLAVDEYRELGKITKRPATIARCKVMADSELRMNPEAGRKVLLDAIAEGGADAPAWLAVAATYTGRQPAEQKDAFEKALAIDPNREDAMVGLVRAEQLHLNFEGAARRLEALVQRRPNRHEWRRALIELKLVLRDFDGALVLAGQPLSGGELEVKDRDAYRAEVIKALTWAGKDDDVVLQLEQWISADPNDRIWPVYLAEHYLDMAQPGKATELYAQLYAQDQSNRAMRQRLMGALLANKQYERAMQHALDWVQETPQDDHANHLLIRALAAGEQMEQAVEIARGRLWWTPHRESYQDWLVAQNVVSKQYSDAIAMVEVLLDTSMRLFRSASEQGRLNPTKDGREEEWTHYPDGPFTPEKLHARTETLRLGGPGRPGLINVLHTAREFGRAAELLEEWLDGAGHPSTRQMYLKALGGAYQLAGQLEKATSAFERALVLNPNDVGLSNDLAYMWIDRGLRLDEAEPLIRFAVGHAPQQAAYLDTYGWLLYKKGDFAGALEWLLRANGARGEEDPVILDHLGDTCWRLQKTDEAISYWQKGILRLEKQETDEILNPDERRVKIQAPRKIEATQAGEKPQIATVAAESRP